MKRTNNRLKRIEEHLKSNDGNQSIDVAKQAEAIKRYFEGVPYEEAGFQEVKRKLTPKQQQYQDEIFNKYLS